jgi:hypothetical protein
VPSRNCPHHGQIYAPWSSRTGNIVGSGEAKVYISVDPLATDVVLSFDTYTRATLVEADGRQVLLLCSAARGLPRRHLALVSLACSLLRAKTSHLAHRMRGAAQSERPPPLLPASPRVGTSVQQRLRQRPCVAALRSAWHARRLLSVRPRRQQARRARAEASRAPTRG